MKPDVRSFNLRLAALALALPTACGGRADANRANAPATSGAIGDAGISSPSMVVPVANAESVIRTQVHPGAKKCFKEALESGSRPVGRIVCRLDVAPDGSVASSTIVDNTGVPEEMATCIADVARHAKFDPPGPKGARISVPFNFKIAE